MPRPLGMTARKLKVLVALAQAPELERSGAEIGRDIGLVGGPLYVTLHQLAKAGWLESRWEVGDPKRLGRPRRRYYRVTAAGLEEACAGVLDRHPAFRTGKR